MCSHFLMLCLIPHKDMVLVDEASVVASLLVAVPETWCQATTVPGVCGMFLYGMESRYPAFLAHFSAHKFCMDSNDPLYASISLYLSMQLKFSSTVVLCKS